MPLTQMMQRPGIIIFLYLILGIVAASAGGALAFVMIGVGLFVLFGLYRKFRYGPIFVAALFMLVGMGRFAMVAHSPITQAEHTTTTGQALDIGVTGGHNQRVMVDTVCGLRVMLYIPSHLPWAQLGQQVTATGSIMPLTTNQNPGGYSQYRHLRPLGVDGTMRPEAVTTGEVVVTFRVRLAQFRDRLANVYLAHLPMRKATIIISMVLGDRSDLPQYVIDQYRATGIFHILSISGLHITAIMVALNHLLGLFFANKKNAGALTLVAMILYCLITGAAVATVRAVTMGGVMVVGRIIGRRYDMLAAVAWAGIGLLLYQPLFVFTIGFQLSFAAVFSIGIIPTAVERLFTKVKIPALVRQALAVTMGTSLGTNIVFMFHFFEISTYAMLGNLVVGPTTGIILVAGLAMGLVGLLPGAVPGAVAEVLAGTVYFILQFFYVTSWFFSSLPHAMLLTGGNSLVLAGLLLGVVVLFVLTFYSFGAAMRRYAMGLMAMILVAGVGFVVVRNPLRQVEITLLATHSNYSVVRHRGDVLVVAPAVRGGENHLNRYLDMHGVHRLDGVLLTGLVLPQNMDNLLAVLEERRVGLVFSTVPQEGLMEYVYMPVGSQRVIGGKALEVVPGGVMVRFADFAVAIGQSGADAHVQIDGRYVVTTQRVLSTADDGAIQIRMSASGVTVE